MRGLCQALSHIRRITHVIGETKDNINLTVAGMEDVPKKASADATAEARTNVALCPGVCREDEGPKAEGSFLLPAQCCVESSRFASKDLKANGIGDVSQPTPSGTHSSVPGNTAGPPSGLAVGPAPPCTRRAPPPALPAQGSRRPAWPTSSRHPGCGQQ